MRPSHLPLRLTTGAFILNAGLSNRHLDKESAAALQGLAANAFPRAGALPPKVFGKVLSTGELVVGGVLLSPFVSPVVAGAVLTAFGAGMLQTYRRSPGLTQADGLRPTQDGVVLAKDVWLVGAGLALLLDGLIDGGKDAAKGARRSARRSAKRARKALEH